MPACLFAIRYYLLKARPPRGPSQEENSLELAPFQVNPELDPGQLSQKYRVSGRLHIASFLDPGGAEALHSHLEHEVPWSYFLFSKNHLWEVAPESRRDYTPEQEDALYDLVYSAVQDGYAFIYETNQLTMRDANGTNKRAPHTPLIASFESFLSSRMFMDFARRVTGEGDIVRAEANATCFREGQFLAAHDDSAASTRRVAFVVNLSRSWRPEWGGLLEFISPSGHVEEAFVPFFNSLNLFRVPQAHAVSCVTPFASGPRLAISGWLHAQ
jgi:SM-20-related protein